MKKLRTLRYLFVLFSVIVATNHYAVAQEDTAASAPVPVIHLQYFNENNTIQYLILHSQLKNGKVFTPQANKTYDVYLDSVDAGRFVSKFKTNNAGKAKSFLPPGLKSHWDALEQHTFIVVEGEEEVLNDYVITKSRVEIDTSSDEGVRSITVTVKKRENGEWMPVPDVEMKVGVKRLGSILPAGEEPTYTTDSSGIVVVEFKRDSLPGDARGNVILAARIEDNELLGNIQREKMVPWGSATTIDKSFFEKRTLWSTRFRTP